MTVILNETIQFFEDDLDKTLSSPFANCSVSVGIGTPLTARLMMTLMY